MTRVLTVLLAIGTLGIGATGAKVPAGPVTLRNVSYNIGDPEPDDVGSGGFGDGERRELGEKRKFGSEFSDAGEDRVGGIAGQCEQQNFFVLRGVRELGVASRQRLADCGHEALRVGRQIAGNRDRRQIGRPAGDFGVEVLRMAPLGVMVSSLILLLVGVRRDYEVLGLALTWGASLAQLGLSIVLIWVAAHESTPTNRLPKNVVCFVAVVTALVVVTVTWLTFSTSPASGPSRFSPLVLGLACGIGSTIAGGILVGLFSWVYRNSLTTRPAAAGAFYGPGSGVALNASWRLACPVSTPWHALGAHGTAVIATAILGALAGRIVATRRQSLPKQAWDG